VAERRSQLIEWAIDLADGNPFFLVELAVHCRTENPDETLPESLQTALDRKIDTLSPSSRLLIQSCAILGENSTFGRLDSLLALPAHVVAVAVSELEASGLISSRDGRVTCRHELIRDAVLRGVTSALGAYLHRRCAVLLATELTGSPTSALAWDCVRHWDGAHDHGRALETTSLIVDQLLSLGLPAEAARLCHRAERYCLTPEQHAERLLKLSRAQRLLYDWDGVVQSIESRNRLLGASQIRAAKYSEDEIALFEAHWWQRCDARILRPAVRRVVDTRAPLLH